MRNVLWRWGLVWLVWAMGMLGVARAQEPKLMLPVGHTRQVFSAVFSPNGKYILTASMDGSTLIWDVGSGKLINDLRGHTNGGVSPVFSATLSPNGKYVVTASYDKTAKIWDMESGKLLNKLIGHTQSVQSAIFSPDGMFIVTGSGDSTAKIWDVRNGKLIHNLKGHTRGVYISIFSPDGKFVLTISDDSTGKIWNVKNGKLLHTLTGLAMSNLAYQSVFSPNGKFIITTCQDSTAKIWNVESGNLFLTLKGHSSLLGSANFSPDGKHILSTSSDSTAKIWDVESGKLLQSLKALNTQIHSAVFSSDMKYILTSTGDDGGTVDIWDAKRGILLHKLFANSGSVALPVFSPDGKYILITPIDNSSTIWETASGKLLYNLKGHNTGRIYECNFSSDMRHLVIKSEEVLGLTTANINVEGKVRICDFKTGKLLNNFDASSADYSPNGKYILTSSYKDKTSKIWSVSNGNLYLELIGHTDSVLSTVFSPDGKLILTASRDNTAKIWDVETGKLLHDLKLHTDDVFSASFSPDNKYVITISLDKTVKIWETQSGQLLNELNRFTDIIIKSSFSPDSKYIATATKDGTASIWELSSGELLHKLKGHSKTVTSAEFSIDGKLIVTASEDGIAKVWQIKSGDLLYELHGHNSYLTSAVFSPDGKYILTVGDWSFQIWDVKSGGLFYERRENSQLHSVFYSSDGRYILSASDTRINIYSSSFGKLLTSTIAVDSNDYLIIDSAGHYDGTEAARKLLYYVCGNEIIDLDQLKEKLYVPGLAELIMKGEKIGGKGIKDLEICSSTPIVETLQETGQEYKYHITPRKGGLGKVELYIGEKRMIRTYKPEELKKKGDSYELNIKRDELKEFLIPGQDDQLHIKAYQVKDGIYSRGIGLDIESGKAKGDTVIPTVYGVYIGVNDCKSDDYHLNYAARDAEDLAKTVSASAAKWFGTDHVVSYLLISERGKKNDAGKENIRKTLEEISKKAKPEDIFLIFFAGHGKTEDQFYFITSDAGQYTSLQEAGISTRELLDWISLQKMHARKGILIFDACNSGQFGNDMAKMKITLRSNTETLRKKDIENLNDKTGMFILSATDSNQSAMELQKYGHGLLTYALLKAIKEKSGILEENQFLKPAAWFDEADNIVREESSRKEQPQLKGDNNFRIGIVDRDIKEGIKLAKVGILFTSSNFYNPKQRGDRSLSNKVNTLLMQGRALRGEGAAIKFIENSPSTDAYYLSGDYLIEGKIVIVNFEIDLTGIETPLQKYEIKGELSKMDDLAKAIVEKTLEYLGKVE